MLTLEDSFQLKEIDWTLFGIVSGILLGIIALVCVFFAVSRLVKKRRGDIEVSDNGKLSYIKSHLTELIYLASFVVVFVLLFAGKFYITWKVDDVKTTDSFLFYNLIFGGQTTLYNQPYTFNPNILLVSGFALLIIGLVSLTNLFFKEEKTGLVKTLNIIALLCNVTFLILLAVTFNQFNNFYDFSSLFPGEFETRIDSFSYASFFTVFLIILLALCNVRRIFNSVKYTTQDVCEEAILIALAVVLDSFVSFKIQAGGGSIGFAAIPLFIIAIRHGPYKGFVASAIMFGLITCMIDGYGFQTYPFDYFIGFGGYCLVGLFFQLFQRFYKNKVGDPNYKHYEFLYSVLGVTVGCIGAMVVRYIGSTTSSMVLYGYNITDALIYNSTYIPFCILLDWFITILLLKPILEINRRFKYTAK